MEILEIIDLDITLTDLQDFDVKKKCLRRPSGNDQNRLKPFSLSSGPTARKHL